MATTIAERLEIVMREPILAANITQETRNTRITRTVGRLGTWAEMRPTLDVTPGPYEKLSTGLHICQVVLWGATRVGFATWNEGDGQDMFEVVVAPKEPGPLF